MNKLQRFIAKVLLGRNAMMTINVSDEILMRLLVYVAYLSEKAGVPLEEMFRSGFDEEFVRKAHFTELSVRSAYMATKAMSIGREAEAQVALKLKRILEKGMSTPFSEGQMNETEREVRETLDRKD